MSEQTLNVKILLRNDTSANWKTKNPVLENGELGIETDTRLMKFGDGTSTWTKLNYINTVTADEATQWGGLLKDDRWFGKVYSYERDGKIVEAHLAHYPSTKIDIDFFAKVARSIKL